MSFLRKLFGGGSQPQATITSKTLDPRAKEILHGNYFWVFDHVVPLLGTYKRPGRVERVLASDPVEVDWFSGHSKGLKIEKESDLRLDPKSSVVGQFALWGGQSWQQAAF